MKSSRKTQSHFLVILSLAEIIVCVKAATYVDGRAPQEFDKLEHHKMLLGVQMLYDDMFLQSRVKCLERTNLYLSALLNAAKLRFANMMDPVIDLVLTKITPVDDEFLFRDRFGDVNYYRSVQYMKDGALGYEVSFEGADLVLFVTGRPVEPPVLRQDGSWIGTPTIGGVCTRDRFGLVHDNGKSFSGATDLAQQISFLLGAVRPVSPDGSLLSQAGGGSQYYGLSKEGKAAILNHYKRHHRSESCCWKDRPRPIKPKYPVDFLLDRRVDICEAAYGAPYKECTLEADGKRVSAQCRIACCKDGGPIREVFVPDGAKCGSEGQMCIYGWCIDRVGDYLTIPSLMIPAIPGGTAYDWDKIKSEIESDNSD
uniref:Putative metalloprotease n=1 Tax=Ixodes ricinus TaxID=34613 RepID=A0A0K8RDR6_IXORI